MITYRYYLLEKPLKINNRSFELLVISSHYEKNYSYYMNDKIIKAVVDFLNDKTFIPKMQGKLVNSLKNETWESIFLWAFVSLAIKLID